MNEWMKEAICTGMEHVYFPEEGHTAMSFTQIEEARVICYYCPVREVCLADAMQREGAMRPENRYGIWGGATPDERASMYRRRIRATRDERTGAAS